MTNMCMCVYMLHIPSAVVFEEISWLTETISGLGRVLKAYRVSG